MSSDFVRSREIDREPNVESDSDLCSEISEDIFDDSDEDSSYDPNGPQRKCFLTLWDQHRLGLQLKTMSKSKVSYQTSRPVLHNYYTALMLI